jgi:hypothetical protein
MIKMKQIMDMMVIMTSPGRPPSFISNHYPVHAQRANIPNDYPTVDPIHWSGGTGPI